MNCGKDQAHNCRTKLELKVILLCNKNNVYFLSTHLQNDKSDHPEVVDVL